jgi:hypothetical protein
LDGIGRIGEVDGAVGFDHNVVGAVEPLALVLLSQHRAGAICRDPADLATIVSRGEYLTVAV